MNKIILLSVAVSVIFGLSLIAQTPDIGHGGPCRDDVEKFCKATPPVADRIWTCLKGRETELSAPCTEYIAMLRERMSEFVKACREDRYRFCGGIRPGKGGIARCLKNRQAELTGSCRAFFEKY